MKRNFKTLLISGLCALAAVPVLASNPIVKGWYADPEIRIFDGQYWIYPTYSDHYGSLDTSPEFTDAQKDFRKHKMVRPSYGLQTFRQDDRRVGQACVSPCRSRW